MDYQIITQKEAIKLLKSGTNISDYKVVFNEDKVEALDAILLGKNKISVPEELIFYDDTSTDFSDDADITDEDIEAGRILIVN